MSSATSSYRTDAGEWKVRYDRQIRLWGSTTQQHLMHTTVVLQSFDGGSCEVAKNLILGGIGSVLIAPSSDEEAAELCTEDCLRTNFFVHAEDVAHRRLRVCAVVDRLRRLNPLVKIDDTLCSGAGSGLELHTSPMSVCRLLSQSSSPKAHQAHHAYVVRRCASRGSMMDAAAAWDNASATCDDIDVTLVLTNYTAFTSVTFFLDQNAGECRSAQLREAFCESDPVAMAGAPAPLQVSILVLLLQDRLIAERDEAPSTLFGQVLARLLYLRKEHHLYDVSDAHIQRIMEAWQHRTLDAADCVLYSTTGAAIAQQMITRIGAPQSRVGDVAALGCRASEEQVGAPAASPTTAPTVYSWYAVSETAEGAFEVFVG